MLVCGVTLARLWGCTADAVGSILTPAEAAKLPEIQELVTAIMPELKFKRMATAKVHTHTYVHACAYAHTHAHMCIRTHRCISQNIFSSYTTKKSCIMGSFASTISL